MHRYASYKSRVDKVLETLRARLLGQEEPLISFLPKGVTLTPEQTAERLADVLSFVLKRAEDLTPEEQKAAWKWLRAAVYCLWDCTEGDRTGQNLVKLAELTAEVRKELNLSKAPKGWAEDFTEGPRCLRSLPAAIWMLNGKQEGALERVEKATFSSP